MVACVGSTAAGRAQAVDELEPLVGARPRAHASLAGLLAEERVDALAITSPDGTHGAGIEGLPTAERDHALEILERNAALPISRTMHQIGG